ncbi:transpeptidase family protein [bacterium]|nr:transpeptidase family protein [bacterium]MBU1652743.1 transpeptidase family protein [bacterium]
MGIAILLVFLVLTAKLVQLQILKGRSLAQIARRQQTTTVDLDSRRGRILDRHGKELAVDLPQLYTLGVHPGNLNKKSLLCQELASFTGRPVSHYLRRLNSSSKFVYLEWRLTEAQADRLGSLNIGGLTLQRTSGRFYPYDRATSQLLGYTDVDGRGIAGLEVFCDSVLQGEKGHETRQRNARGRSIWDPLSSYTLPKDGGTVRLTIDIVAQEVLHNELQKVQEQYKSEWAGGILMNPKTGEILAICSVPDFDPLRPEAGPVNNHKLRPLTDLMEPGSVMKIIGATAALERKTFHPTDSIYCENGLFSIGSNRLRDVHKFGWLTFEDVMVNSSNIGMAKAADKTGAKEIYRYALRYGFGSPAGVPFPGEAGGVLRTYDTWKPIDLANIAMGQGVSATMLQVALAFGAVANDGILMEPRLILNETYPTGEPVARLPRETRRVMEPHTARTVKQILVEAVERGTGESAKIEGVRVAGKTGTAQIPDLKRGGYLPNYIASFIGFLPADDPDRLLIIAVVDPKGQHYGSQVAAPVFRRMMQRLLPADVVRRSWNTQPLDIVDLYQKSDNGFIMPVIEEAVDWIKHKWLSDVSHSDKAATLNDELPQSLPDLKGRSLRDAIVLLSECGVEVKIHGNGWVVHQNPAAGTPLIKDMVCVLTAKP